MLSIIILAYNRRQEALKTIRELMRLQLGLGFETEIIVVDNASSDNTSLQIKSQFPNVRLIIRDTNNGIAGWNDGFAIAKYKYFLVLDDDSHVHSGLVGAIDRMESNPDIGILGLQVKDEQLKMDEHLDPQDAWKDGEEIAGFIGCGALIRKEVYERIGGFAEWLFVYTHEFEYAIRCLDAGYRVSFYADCIIIHRASVINRTNKRLRIFGTRNELAIIHRFFRENKFKYLFRTLVNNLKFIKREGPMSGYFVLRGFYEYLKLRADLPVSPVQSAVQNYYAEKFWSTKPILRTSSTKERPTIK